MTIWTAVGIIVIGLLVMGGGVAVTASRTVRMTDGAQGRRVNAGSIVAVLGGVVMLIGLGYLGFVLISQT